MKLPKLWRSPNEAIACITFILLLIGTLNIFSASFVKAGQGTEIGDSYYFVKRHLIFVLVGGTAALLLWRLDYRIIKRLSIPAAAITLLALLAVFFIGITANGAKRWISIGPLGTFQPSELAKLTSIIMAARYLGPRLDRGRVANLFSIPIYFCVLAAGMVQIQPDMGTAMIVLGLCLLLYIITGLPRGQMLMLAIFGILALGKLTYMASYRAERIAAWLDPWSHSLNIGYQTVQSLLAIGSGGLMGAGFGMGTSKFYYLPEAHTDFAFAVLCQETGFLGAATVLILFGVLAVYGGFIARKAPDGFGKMLATGAIALIVGQAVINVAMVTGVLPVIGVPLPFISYGGTSLVVSFLAIGMLVSVGRQIDPSLDKNNTHPGHTVPNRRPDRPRLRLIGKDSSPNN